MTLNELGIAGVLCLAMAVGHTVVGVRYVLPTLTGDRVVGTGLGPPAMTLATIRVTWYVVTLFLLSLGGLLVVLAWAAPGDPSRFALRWLAVSWLAGTVMAAFVIPIRPRTLRMFLRLPVPVVWIAVAALCWAAA